MSVQERNEYREQLRLIGTDQARDLFQMNHRNHVDQRASALDHELEEAE
jgi:hypothetical protein